MLRRYSQASDLFERRDSALKDVHAQQGGLDSVEGEQHVLLSSFSINLLFETFIFAVPLVSKVYWNRQFRTVPAAQLQLRQMRRAEMVSTQYVELIKQQSCCSV